MKLILLLLVVILCFYWIKLEKKRNTRLIKEIIDSFRNNSEVENLPSEIKENYTQLYKELKKQKNELENSLSGLKEYRNELEITYDVLIKKSSMLEYMNQALEKKVSNLSNLNALSRTVLSVIELEKTVGIILDAYFVLTGAKRISLYLWEKGNLKLQKVKGNVRFRGELNFDPIELESYTTVDYEKVYEGLSHQFRVSDDETVIMSPLVVKDKQLGVIFVIEDKEKLIDIDQEMISALVIQISIAINNAKIYADLLIKERISKELELAARIQKKIIPQDVKNILGLQVANYFGPAKEIGGDYYDYYLYNNETFSITMADVSGKGVPAAFLMALARAILRTLCTRGVEPRKDLRDLNKIIYPDINEDMFITIMHCKFNYETKELTYSNAGHNPIIIYNAVEDEIQLRTVKGLAIGFLEEYNYVQDKTTLNQNDIVVLYTDGITECENEKKELFGMERLKKIIYDNRFENVEIIKNNLLKELDKFKNTREQSDDITFVILKNLE